MAESPYEMIILWLCFTFLVIYVGLLMYYRLAWTSIPDFQLPKNFTPVTFISIIIPARNEETHLPILLDSLLQQTYPVELFEVIVVDDHSTDDTARIIDSYVSGNIKRISLASYMHGPNINSYKKKAIKTGISESKGDLIVTTDADCYAPENWLMQIAAFYERYKPAFIAAPVSINCSARFIEMFQAIDFMSLQGITGASVHKKFHNMCNGANMAYEKDAFYKVNGFEGIDSIASGDDMLLMHKIRQQYPDRVMFLKSYHAIVHTAPVKTVSAFLNQRIRWASKTGKYNDPNITIVLSLVYLLNVILLLLPLISIFFNPAFTIYAFSFFLFSFWLFLLAVKTIAELFFLFPVAIFFGKQQMLWLFPLLQPFHIVYTVIAGWLGKYGSYQWKERKVK
jgi:cellulose synthase/poly-beta-1,6-N-acetylglucosamine synthase-like glycosyltransferase